MIIHIMDKLVRAIHFAAEKHANQRRKDAAKTPYINHPIHVMYLLSECGVTDIDTLCAAVLHDTIEDTKTTYKEIVENFDESVAVIVNECSDDKSLPKVTRKQLQIEHAETISNQAKLVKMADKYSNMSGLMDNPPANWSKDEINGYIAWSYAVCLKLYGVNEMMDQKLHDLFYKFYIDAIPETELNKLLENYYKIINNSE